MIDAPDFSICKLTKNYSFNFCLLSHWCLKLQVKLLALLMQWFESCLHSLHFRTLAAPHLGCLFSDFDPLWCREEEWKKGFPLARHFYDPWKSLPIWNPHTHCSNCKILWAHRLETNLDPHLAEVKCHKAYKRIKNFLRSNATQLYKDDDDHLLHGDDDASRQRVGHGTSMTRDKSLLHFSVLLCYALQMSCAEGVNYVFEKCTIKERTHCLKITQNVAFEFLHFPSILCPIATMYHFWHF